MSKPTLRFYDTTLTPRSLDFKFPKRRQRAADRACRSLEDKASNVRKNAIKLLTKLVTTHPFNALHGGTLMRTEWATRLEALDAELSDLMAQVEGLNDKAPGNETMDAEMLDDVTDDENENGDKEQTAPEPVAPTQQQPDNSENITRLQLTRRYYLEALKFIDTIHAASEVVAQLLSAKGKSEVIEAMDFFKTLDIHKIETAKSGIRRMLRLIWTKGNSDEGKGVQTHLIETYKELFFNAPGTLSENECAIYIAKNMISLTYKTTAAELTSLEQLLSKMMSEGHIPGLVVQKLWGVYGQKKEISRTQRRGAIIVLGMLALADPEIVVKDLETILRIGLGPLGRADLGLAKYSCVALRHMMPAGKKGKGNHSPLYKVSIH